jgi:Secretion system C-terminal sorting domain
MHTRRLPRLAVVLVMAATTPAFSQVAYPDHTIQDVSWTNGTHHTAVTQKIVSPGVPTLPVEITDVADAEFVSGTQVRLTDGFHAGDFTGSGRFRAYIDDGLGPDGDVVTIAPDPATHMVNNILHVEKWEKFEIGLRLPQEYLDAIDRFFANYYSNGETEFATPNNLDRAHDLNPYADDSLQLVMTLTSPSNVQHMKWGFFLREARWRSASLMADMTEDTTDLLHPYNIRFRFAPEEEGLWQFALSIKAPHTATLANAQLPDLQFSGYGFVCDPPLPDNKGYLKVDTINRRVLQFADGTPFFAIGTNLGTRRGNTAWSDPLGYALVQGDFKDMKESMEKLQGVGGNFARIFLMRHEFAPEWVNLGVYDFFKSVDPCDTNQGMPTYTSNCQYHCWAFDSILDVARDNDIYVQLCIDPYPPIVAYENFIWGAHPYVTNFIEPNSPNRPYDVKQFFYQNGNDSIKDQGVFYYWKRKYKYIMARWGYSVNLAIVEPFNEPDQMLSYRWGDHTHNDNNTLCPENRLVWPADPLLPVRYNDWLTDIIGYVRDSVNFSDPVSSPLGESRQLFLTGTGSWGSTGPDFLLPCKNPKLDLIDVHHGMYWGEGELRNAFNASQDYRNTYTSVVNGNTIKKPFHQGESNYYALGYYVDGPDTFEVETSDIFSNYDVSFHNELWASTFFGNFGAASTWHWKRVFWFDDNAMPTPPADAPIGGNPGNQWQQSFSNVLGDTNRLDVGIPGGYPIANKTVYHHFKPLTDMLSNPDWQSYNFFAGNYTPHKVFDDTNKLECYYLMNADSNLAIGWVHNLNAYWENQFYLKHSVQNFLGCNDPGAQFLTLSGFQSGADLHVTYFPTRMDTTVYPESQVDSSGTGTVTLDLSTVPLNGITNNYIDTLHSDYAFIIALQPVVKGMISSDENDASNAPSDWDFMMYPNPAGEVLNVLLPTDGVLRDVALYDLTGKRIYARRNIASHAVDIPTGSFANGAYCVRVSDPAKSKMKTLIIH